jgi:hypothetical protein
MIRPSSRFCGSSSNRSQTAPCGQSGDRRSGHSIRQRAVPNASSSPSSSASLRSGQTVEIDVPDFAHVGIVGLHQREGWRRDVDAVRPHTQGLSDEGPGEVALPGAEASGQEERIAHPRLVRHPSGEHGGRVGRPRTKHRGSRPAGRRRENVARTVRNLGFGPHEFETIEGNAAATPQATLSPCPVLSARPSAGTSFGTGSPSPIQAAPDSRSPQLASVARNQTTVCPPRSGATRQ